MDPLPPESISQTPPTRENPFSRFATQRPGLVRITIAILILGVVGGVWYWRVLGSRIFSDKAEISSPLVDLSPEKPGVLRTIFVKEGDMLLANQNVARIDDTSISTKTAGVVVGINNEIGKLFTPGMPVVTMINPQDLRVVARIPENKGFNDVRIGQNVIFTVDAFGSKEFNGVVDEIAKTSLQSSVVFSISDKREAKEFVVKIKYDVNESPQLLNGMSARVWIYR